MTTTPQIPAQIPAKGIDIDKLLPCPFCGGQPKIRTESLDERFSYANEVIVQCSSCGCKRSARGDTSKPGYADNSTTEQRAIEAWNRRAAPAAGTEKDTEPAEASVNIIRGAIADYYRALNARQHGELAMDRSFRAIERELGMSWDMWTRAENAAIGAHTKAGEPVPDLNYDRAQLDAWGQHDKK